MIKQLSRHIEYFHNVHVIDDFFLSQTIYICKKELLYKVPLVVTYSLKIYEYYNKIIMMNIICSS